MKGYVVLFSTTVYTGALTLRNGVVLSPQKEFNLHHQSLHEVSLIYRSYNMVILVGAYPCTSQLKTERSDVELEDHDVPV